MIIDGSEHFASNIRSKGLFEMIACVIMKGWNLSCELTSALTKSKLRYFGWVFSVLFKNGSKSCLMAWFQNFQNKVDLKNSKLVDIYNEKKFSEREVEFQFVVLLHCPKKINFGKNVYWKAFIWAKSPQVIGVEYQILWLYRFQRFKKKQVFLRFSSITGETTIDCSRNSFVSSSLVRKCTNTTWIGLGISLGFFVFENTPVLRFLFGIKTRVKGTKAKFNSQV